LKVNINKKLVKANLLKCGKISNTKPMDFPTF